MIIKLDNGLCFSTTYDYALEYLKEGTVHKATTQECEDMLRAIPLDEISEHPNAYRTLALCAARGYGYVGEERKGD